MLLLSKFKVLGHSMEPHIKNNSMVLVSGIPYIFKSPKVNDIVVFRDNGRKIMIKRIMDNNKNKYFVEGDNKNDSLDSRKFGSISRKQIVGQVIYKL